MRSRRIFTAFGLALLSSGLVTAGVRATTVTLDGQSYEFVDWQSVSNTSGEAAGTVLGTSVTYSGSPSDGSDFFRNESIGAHDYSSGPAFDALDYPGSGEADHVQIFGAKEADVTLSFGRPIRSVLLVVGAPNAENSQLEYGSAEWDLGPVLAGVVDGEGGFRILTGTDGSSITDNENDESHESGIFTTLAPDGSSAQLDWEQAGIGGPDRMDVTFAVHPVPEPATGALLGLAFRRQAA